VNADVPLLVDGEEIPTPVVQVVDLGGVGDGPAFGDHIIPLSGNSLLKKSHHIHSMKN
jgi:hypothetical protein